MEVDIETVELFGELETASSYVETLALRTRVPSSHNNFSFPQSSTRVSITRLLKHGKCFLFLHEGVVQNLTIR